MLLNVTLILFHVSLFLFFFTNVITYIGRIFFFINHCGVTTCGQTDQEPVKLSKVSKVKLRFVSNNFRRKASVSEMLHNLGWQSLDSRRQDQRLVLFYKIINGLASVETEDILTPADFRTRKNHSFKFKHLQANCDSYTCRYSFFPATISSWNNLPFGIEKVDSVEGFKLKLKEHTFRSP